MQKNSLLQEFDYPLTSENGVAEAEPNISWHVVTPTSYLYRNFLTQSAAMSTM